MGMSATRADAFVIRQFQDSLRVANTSAHTGARQMLPKCNNLRKFGKSTNLPISFVDSDQHRAVPYSRLYTSRQTEMFPQTTKLLSASVVVAIVFSTAAAARADFVCPSFAEATTLGTKVISGPFVFELFDSEHRPTQTNRKTYSSASNVVVFEQDELRFASAPSAMSSPSVSSGHSAGGGAAAMVVADAGIPRSDVWRFVCIQYWLAVPEGALAAVFRPPIQGFAMCAA